MTNTARAVLALFLTLFLALPACKQAPPAPAEEPLATRPAKADPNDWCVGHDVPESMCTKCHKVLIARYKEVGDYCEEHAFPESVCPICNPLAAPNDAPATDDHHDEH